MLTIRQYHDADKDAVWELHHIALDRIGFPYRDGPRDQDMHDIPDHYLKIGGEFIVGLLDNKIVCMGAFRKKSETTAEVKRMRVLPDYQRRGFGQTILNQLEARAKQMGYEEFILDTTTRQIAAQKLYEQNGFVEVKREKLPELEMQELELIYYRKTLV